jgi:hypothetical protein
MQSAAIGSTDPQRGIPSIPYLFFRWSFLPEWTGKVARLKDASRTTKLWISVIDVKVTHLEDRF